jgi:hypothetical protein
MNRNVKIAIMLSVALGLCAFLSTTTWSIPVTNAFNRHNMSFGADDSHPHATDPALGTGGTDRICIFCHTPHTGTPESPLWSRPEPETATFDLYAGRLAIKDASSSSQYNSVQYPNGASRMCMSCHDGATAIGTILGQPAEIEMTDRFVTGSALIDLSKSHPISFLWDSVVAAEVNSWHLSEASGSIYNWPPNYNIAPLDGNTRMQCTTCHDPHEDPSRDLGGNPILFPNDFPPFWRHTAGCVGDSQACYDAVCNECHDGTAPPITPPTPGSGGVHNSAVLLP